VEKCLKAFLTAANRHVEKTHDLTRLVELCSQVEEDFQRLRDIAVQLTDYAVAGRYPDDWEDMSVEEARAAVESAVEAMAFVRRKLPL
jgi:HEPN domain-containing protein